MVKKGALMPFLPDILFVDLVKALDGRPNAYTEARQLCGTVISRLIKSNQQVYASTEISHHAAAVLQRFNRQAWLRYIAEHPSTQLKRFTS